MIKLNCFQCKKDYKTSTPGANRSVKHFCSKECIKNYNESRKTYANCGNCDKEIRVIPRDQKKSKSGKNFCSRSCSAQYVNKYKIRELKYKCKSCDIPIDWRRKYCDNCKIKIKIKNQYKNKTLGEIKIKRNDAGRYAYIRFHSRKLLDHLSKICANCNFNKCLEVCHIKKIIDFPDTATIEEINNPENIIILCRNCHWLLDHGELTIEQIKQNQSFITNS